MLQPSPPPPRATKRCNADEIKVTAPSNRSIRGRERKAEEWTKSELLRYLRKINRRRNPRLLLITLQQILKLHDICGIYHREQILECVPSDYEKGAKQRLLKVTAELLEHSHKKISEDLKDLKNLKDLKDLGGAA